MHRRSFLKLAGVPALQRIVSHSGAGESPAPSPRTGAWSFVVLPDTQCYSESYPDVFMSQTEWIVRNRQARNIQFVLHLGDITNNNVHPEWINARRAMDVIKRANIPHLLVVGNHDL